VQLTNISSDSNVVLMIWFLLDYYQTFLDV